jgi:glycosyltransferase involved in cell wall biosynthesis
MDIAAICVDTVFNREVVEYPNKKLQACVFSKSADSVSKAIQAFESEEEHFNREAKCLGARIRSTMSWDNIYEQYKKIFVECMEK